jgi:putative transposase
LEGAYFVTIGTFHHLSLFGEIEDGAVQLNPNGNIATDQWVRLSSRFYPSDFSIFVIMPNHVHGIIHIVGGAGKEFETAPSGVPPQRPYRHSHYMPSSLGIIVRAYKSAFAYRINAMRGSAQPPIWQRNYYEHIIRNENEYEQIMDYIESNPATWIDNRFYATQILK